MTLGKALHVIVVILMVTFSNLQITEANADVRLSLDNPCFQGQDCTLNCSAVRGSKTDGYQYFQDSAQIVFCSGPSSCNSNVPAFQHDVGDSQSSSVTMVSFNPTSMSGSWQCQDGSSGTASNTYNVILNVEPSGNLSLSGDCPGSCTVSCSCDVLGSPPATLILSGSSGQLINGTTSPVTYVLQESDNVTCSVQWTEFPAYTLNILSVTSSFSISGSTTPVSTTNASTATGILPSTADGTSSNVPPSVATPPSAAPSPHPENLILIIVLSCIAFFILIIIIVVLLIFCVRRRKRSRENKSKDNDVLEMRL